jgi:macrolide transport system ATP-binding/permease protein
MLTSVSELARRLRAFFRPGSFDRDFDQELELHLNMLAEDHSRRGLTPEEARRAAQLELGGLTQLREAHRETRGLAVLEAILQDIQYAFRAMRKSPGFTAVAILTLAVGMGVSTAVFTAFNALLLQPVQVPEPTRIVTVTRSTSGKTFPYPDYGYYRDGNQMFSGLVAMDLRTFAMTGVVTPAPVVPTRIADRTGFQLPQILNSERAAAAMVSGTISRC